MRAVLNDDGTLKESDAILREMRKAGIQPESPIIVADHRGVKSAILYLAFIHAGCKLVSNYK